MSRLTDSIPKGSIFWIKWELEDLEGNKFVPPRYHYYNAKATGKKRNNMFQVEYDDGFKEYYSIRGINTRTNNILTDAAYNNGEIITAEEKQPRVGPEFQAVVDASSGPELPNTKFRQNALQLVPLTIKEIEEQDANTQLSAAVQADMDKCGMSKKGYEGGKKSVSKEAVSYFEEFPLYDIGADALSALEILGGGRRTKKKRKSRKKRGGFMAWMGLTADFVKNNFDRLVERGTKIKIKVKQEKRDIILHKDIDENGNTINYIDTDGHYFVYTDPEVHYDTDDEREIIDLEDYNLGDIKINISKPHSGSGRKKRKKRKTKRRKRKRKTRRKR